MQNVKIPKMGNSNNGDQSNETRTDNQAAIAISNLS
jgi:hypothetical protein